jgi:hypothetical protein
MKVGVIRWVLLASIVIVFTTIDYSNLSVAGQRIRPVGKPKVRPVDFKGEKERKFKLDESVYVKGRKFKPLTNVCVYITNNRRWRNGDILTDISSNGVETVQTTSNGRIPKTLVWGAPIVKGNYDVVVDANCDGTFNRGDAVNRKNRKQGFKVRRFFH